MRPSISELRAGSAHSWRSSVLFRGRLEIRRAGMPHIRACRQLPRGYATSAARRRAGAWRQSLKNREAFLIPKSSFNTHSVAIPPETGLPSAVAGPAVRKRIDFVFFNQLLTELRLIRGRLIRNAENLVLRAHVIFRMPVAI